MIYFRYTSDLDGRKPLDLARELGVAANVALSIIKSLSPTDQAPTPSSSSSSTGTLSAMETSKMIQGEKYIITFSRAIDMMLGGGIPIGLSITYAHHICKEFISQPFDRTNH